MPSRRSVLAGLATGGTTTLAGCSNQFGGREYYREFDYNVTVNPTAPISGVTMYVPAPVENDEVVVEDRLDDGIVPEEWAVEVAETDTCPMLQISAEELPLRDSTYILETQWTVAEAIDTRNALENEPTLQPKAEIEQVECEFPHPEKWDDRLRCYDYVGSIFGDFEPAGTEVSVSTGFFGANSWHNGGWSGNDYDDRVHGYVDGTGWVYARGSFIEGSGNY